VIDVDGQEHAKSTAMVDAERERARRVKNARQRTTQWDDHQRVTWDGRRSWTGWWLGWLSSRPCDERYRPRAGNRPEGSIPFSQRRFCLEKSTDRSCCARRRGSPASRQRR